MYKVIKAFTDLHDKEYPYSVGDTFPRVGIKVDNKRLEELSGPNNKQGEPLIEEVKAGETIAEGIRKGLEGNGDA